MATGQEWQQQDEQVDHGEQGRANQTEEGPPVAVQVDLHLRGVELGVGQAQLQHALDEGVAQGHGGGDDHHPADAPAGVQVSRGQSEDDHAHLRGQEDEPQQDPEHLVGLVAGGAGRADRHADQAPDHAHHAADEDQGVEGPEDGAVGGPELLAGVLEPEQQEAEEDEVGQEDE